MKEIRLIFPILCFMVFFTGCTINLEKTFPPKVWFKIRPKPMQQKTQMEISIHVIV
jgi:hypothetical protein